MGSSPVPRLARDVDPRPRQRQRHQRQQPHPRQQQQPVLHPQLLPRPLLPLPDQPQRGEDHVLRRLLHEQVQDHRQGGQGDARDEAGIEEDRAHDVGVSLIRWESGVSDSGEPGSQGPEPCAPGRIASASGRLRIPRSGTQDIHVVISPRPRSVVPARSMSASMHGHRPIKVRLVSKGREGKFPDQGRDIARSTASRDRSP